MLGTSGLNFGQIGSEEMKSELKDRRKRGRPVKNKLAEPINDTTENVMKALLQAKPKSTGYWYDRKPKPKAG